MPIEVDENKRSQAATHICNELCYAYCDNCKFSRDDDNTKLSSFGSDPCETCHRKEQNWALARCTAEGIVDAILAIFEKKEST